MSVVGSKGGKSSAVVEQYFSEPETLLLENEKCSFLNTLQVLPTTNQKALNLDYNNKHIYVS
jgi:hypothetical protein